MGGLLTKDEDVAELTSTSILSPTTKFVDVVKLLCRMACSVSPVEVLSVIRSVPTGDDSNMLGVMAVGASMTAKKAMNDRVSQVGLSKYENFKINETMNFSMYALLGHMLMSFQMSDYTREGAALKAAYMKSIGGSKDLIAFGPNGSIAGKEARSDILKKWVGVIESFDTAKHHNALAEKFPKILLSRRSAAGQTVGLFTGVFKYMLSIVAYALNIIKFFFIKILTFSVLVALVNSLLIIMIEEDYTDNAQKVFSMAGLNVNHPNGLLFPSYFVYNKAFPYMYLVCQVITSIGLSIARGNVQEPIPDQLSSLLPFTPSEMAEIIDNLRDISNDLLTNSKQYAEPVFEWLKSQFPDVSGTTVPGTSPAYEWPNNQVPDSTEITVPDAPPHEPG